MKLQNSLHSIASQISHPPAQGSEVPDLPADGFKDLEKMHQREEAHNALRANGETVKPQTQEEEAGLNYMTAMIIYINTMKALYIVIASLVSKYKYIYI